MAVSTHLRRPWRPSHGDQATDLRWVETAMETKPPAFVNQAGRCEPGLHGCLQQARFSFFRSQVFYPKKPQKICQKTNFL